MPRFHFRPSHLNSQLHHFADWLHDWHITRIMFSLSSLFLMITMAMVWVDYSDRYDERTFRAWDLLSKRTPGNSGKVEALEYLNKEICLLWIVLKPKVSLQGIDLSIPVEGMDRQQISQARPYLVGVQLPQAELSRANLRGVDLSHANLRHSRLRQADLRQAQLWNTDLRHSDLSAARLQGAELHQVRLEQSNLWQARLQGTDLGGAKLQQANLSEANLAGSNLRQADLRGATLKQAILRNSYLKDADLRGIRGLTCVQLSKALAWQSARRDAALACGATLPGSP